MILNRSKRFKMAHYIRLWSSSSSSSGSNFVSVRSPRGLNPTENKTSKEVCSMCASEKAPKASYYCPSCDIFGRFICSSCIPRHSQETAFHVLKHIPDFTKNMSLSALQKAENAEKYKKETEELQNELLKSRELLERLRKEKDKADKAVNDMIKANLSALEKAENAEKYKKETEELQNELLKSREILEKLSKEKDKAVNDMIEAKKELLDCKSHFEEAMKSNSLTSTDTDKAEEITRQHKRFVNEQLKKTNENICRCKGELSRAEVDLGKKRERMSQLEKSINDLEKMTNGTGKQKHITNIKIAELTKEVDELKEEKRKLQKEKEIFLQTIDNLNKQIVADECVRDLLDRLNETIEVNITLMHKINMLEEVLLSTMEISGAPRRQVSTHRGAANSQRPVMPPGQMKKDK